MNIYYEMRRWHYVTAHLASGEEIGGKKYDQGEIIADNYQDTDHYKRLVINEAPGPVDHYTIVNAKGHVVETIHPPNGLEFFSPY
jgi:hypothetical protein